MRLYPNPEPAPNKNQVLVSKVPPNSFVNTHFKTIDCLESSNALKKTKNARIALFSPRCGVQLDCNISTILSCPNTFQAGM